MKGKPLMLVLLSVLMVSQLGLGASARSFGLGGGGIALCNDLEGAVLNPGSIGVLGENGMSVSFEGSSLQVIFGGKEGYFGAFFGSSFDLSNFEGVYVPLGVGVGTGAGGIFRLGIGTVANLWIPKGGNILEDSRVEGDVGLTLGLGFISAGVVCEKAYAVGASYATFEVKPTRAGIGLDVGMLAVGVDVSNLQAGEEGLVAHLGAEVRMGPLELRAGLQATRRKLEEVSKEGLDVGKLLEDKEIGKFVGVGIKLGSFKARVSATPDMKEWVATVVVVGERQQ